MNALRTAWIVGFGLAAAAHGTSGGKVEFERLELSNVFFCEGATFGDFDRDGKQDVVSGPYWYRGPEFREKHELYEPKPFDPAHYSDNFFAFTSDFDRDGWLDVLAVGFPGEATHWYRNPGGKDERWAKHLVLEHTDNESPTFAQLVGDPTPELVCHTAGRLGWAEPEPANPTAPWKWHTLSGDLGLQRFTHGLGVGDVNGDGRADVLLANGWWEQPASLAGDPDWTFHAFAFSDQYGGAQMLVHDVDADGLADVITSMAAHHYGLAWWRQTKQDGVLDFERRTILGSQPEESLDGVQFGELHALALADVDADGVQDVVTGKRWWSHGAAGDPDGERSKAWLYWFRCERKAPGDVRFVPQLASDDIGVGVQVVAGDVNGDGKCDVVVGNKKGTFVARQKAVKVSLTEPQKIEALLAAVAASNATFVRNGDDHTAEEAAEHLRRKWKNDSAVKSARDFIERCATKSSLSGDPYEMQFPDGKRVTTTEWLGAKLASLESGSSAAPRVPRDDREATAQAASDEPEYRSLDRELERLAAEWNDTLPSRGGPHEEPDGRAAPDEGEYTSLDAELARLAALAAAEAQEAGSLPLGADGKPVNTDFETGDLRDWTADGNAFDDQPVAGDTVTARGREASLHQGKFWIGGFEKHGDGRRGTLTSKPFVVSKPFASFLVGGGSFHDERVELVRATDGQTVFRTSAANYESMQRVVVDLTHELGATLYVKLTDDATGGWGHLNFDDFRLHASKPSFTRAAGVPAILPPDPILHAGLPPKEAAAAMTARPGVSVELVLAEPELQQPIAFTFDAKGRLWVLEAFTYPERRPEGQGKDDVLVFEDTNGDGTFDKRTIFIEHLNLASGLEVGHGGVWIGAAPKLYFIPDRNDDLVPDSDPEVVLDGFGYEDTHETLNAFTWGPDGWLYGCHGVFTDALVGKPGTPKEQRVPLNAGVWRYHPTKERFEVFAWGTSNPWGVDFDDDGQAFITACVIPHLYHVIQGARYERQAGAHFDPYVFDDLKTIADHRHYLGATPHGGNNRSGEAGGGHAHCGAMVYLGGAFPAEYRNTIFMSNIHGNRLNNDGLAKSGSGYVGSHRPDFVLANDAWFRGITVKYGPDGSVYFSDWYDKQACHWTEVERWDRTNGRIYRANFGKHTPKRVDLRKLSDAELVELQLEQNDWFVRQARLVLAERKSGGRAESALRGILERNSDPRRKLRALWALHASGGLSQKLAAAQLSSPHEYVVAFAIQFLLEDRDAPTWVVHELTELARRTKSPVVRLYLAAALQRMRLYDRWAIAEALLRHGEDASDHNLPLMLWYAIEPLVPADPKRALGLAEKSAIPLVANFVVRRAAHEPQCQEALVHAISDQQDASRRTVMLAELAEVVRTKRGLAVPKNWPALYAELARSSDAAVRERALAIAVAYGDSSAFGALRGLIADASAPREKREQAFDALFGAKDAELAPVLLRLLDDEALRSRALKALAAYDDPATAQSVLARYAKLGLDDRRAALNTLSARSAWALELLGALESGTVPRTDFGAFALQNLRNLKDPAVDEAVARVFGQVRDTPEEKQKRITELKGLLSSEKRAGASLPRGREVFSRTCQQCHTLFEVGGKLGPDLTGSNRADLDYLLSNVVDPSAVVGKEYQATIVELESGQIVTGIVKRETADGLELATETDVLHLAPSDIAERVLTPNSAMPEGLLDPLSPDEIVDLVAYLANPGQTRILATAANARGFFDGRTLAHWTGDAAVWSVEQGELVGKTTGLAHNSFLLSDYELGDFSLSFEVRLVNDAGNSGVQFRTEPLGAEAGGEVKGYQADIGPGWWGKLYEEGGRGLVWEKSGEQHVVKDGWNRYRIEARGHHVKTWLNDQLCVDLEDPAGALSGIVALQVHSGDATEVRFRKFELDLLAH
ncbi:MAG: DUF5329 family protein [Planctomycetes bacterium]|nr:DUF5329 family protein [Planctomycetota bacterium]